MGFTELSSGVQQGDSTDQCKLQCPMDLTPNSTIPLPLGRGGWARDVIMGVLRGSLSRTPILWPSADERGCWPHSNKFKDLGLQVRDKVC